MNIIVMAKINFSAAPQTQRTISSCFFVVVVVVVCERGGCSNSILVC